VEQCLLELKGICDKGLIDKDLWQLKRMELIKMF